MPKLKLPNIDDVVAIDIHTHAEEPCGTHPDDGYDDFQAQMAEYFKSPHKHPPTVPETAAYYRSKNIAAVIFPVDAERETGFRRYKNEEMLEIASDHLDVMGHFDQPEQYISWFKSGSHFREEQFHEVWERVLDFIVGAPRA